MDFLRSISRRLDSWVQFTVLRRPRNVREAANRALILALVVLAAVSPVFISSDPGDVDQGASDEFAALQAELAEARADLESLDGDSAAAAGLRERIAELEDATPPRLYRARRRRRPPQRPRAPISACSTSKATPSALPTSRRRSCSISGPPGASPASRKCPTSSASTSSTATASP